jgi:hypothetical protein
VFDLGPRGPFVLLGGPLVPQPVRLVSIVGLLWYCIEYDWVNMYSIEYDWVIVVKPISGLFWGNPYQ